MTENETKQIKRDIEMLKMHLDQWESWKNQAMDMLYKLEDEVLMAEWNEFLQFSK